MYKIIILGNCLHVLVTNAFNAMLAATLTLYLADFLNLIDTLPKLEYRFRQNFYYPNHLL